MEEKPQKNAAATPEGEFPVFDRASLMEQVMGDEPMARRLIEVFKGDTPGQITLLKNYLAAGDALNVAQRAHNIRGSSAIVGAQALSALANAMEQAGKEGDMAFVSARMADLDAQFDRLKEVITIDIL